MKEQCNHILIKNAYVYPKREKPLEPDGCYYSFKNGGWMKKENNKNIFLVRSKDPNKPMAGTKKADLETGEDQKDE